MRHDMNEKNLSVRRLTDFARVEDLYRTRMKQDFARNELRPLAWLRRVWNDGVYECYGLFAGEENLGYAFFVRLGGNYLFDYFAIAQGHRDEGLGSFFLRELAARFAGADCVLGEVEDPERAKDADARALRERRLRFYLRSGYRETALTSRVFGADYRLLEVPTATAHTPEELKAIYTALCRSILPGLFFRTQFRVRCAPAGAGRNA